MSDVKIQNTVHLQCPARLKSGQEGERALSNCQVTHRGNVTALEGCPFLTLQPLGHQSGNVRMLAGHAALAFMQRAGQET